MRNNSLNSEKIRKSFINDVKNIINDARNLAVRSVDSCRVKMYWNIGRRIFEEEQQGKHTSLKTFHIVLSRNMEVDLAYVN